ncbi:acyl-CoA dehydrogenase family protein [Streptomyces sp. NPDC058657]|uniref:acyl-CoA dehydrogenase family protein n=1 Tax=unclassified Streptomyces TaxID=2593676 RepID=UPI0036568533
MDAAFTAEQDEVRRTLHELLTKRCGPDEVKAAAATAEGYDRGLWRQLAEELGLPGLALPADCGGTGASFTDLVLACEETGRALLPSPLFATSVLAAPLIRALGTEAQRAALLPGIAAGRTSATLAVSGGALSLALGLTGDNTTHDWAGGGRSGGVQARHTEHGWALYGQAEQVLDGHSADLLLVAAHTGGFARSRTLLFVVRAANAVGLARVRQVSLDETRPQAVLQLRDVPAELLGGTDADAVSAATAASAAGASAAVSAASAADVPGALAQAGCGAAAVLAAEAVGAASSALERTVDYVKAREQFGRAIGSFQAVKHRLADVYVQVAAARSAAYYAAWDPAGGGALALAQGLDALRAAASEAIQLHGGIGVTWEHDAHLYFKRAAADELLFGPVHRLRGHAADRAGVFGAPRRTDHHDDTGAEAV